MTNAEFDAWAARAFPGGDSACGRALEIDRETVKALRTGRTKNGASYPVRAHIALACAAWDAGARCYDGGAAERLTARLVAEAPGLVRRLLSAERSDSAEG